MLAQNEKYTTFGWEIHSGIVTHNNLTICEVIYKGDVPTTKAQNLLQR